MWLLTQTHGLPTTNYIMLQSYVDVVVAGALRESTAFAKMLITTTFGWHGEAPAIAHTHPVTAVASALTFVYVTVCCGQVIKASAMTTLQPGGSTIGSGLRTPGPATAHWHRQPK